MLSAEQRAALEDEIRDLHASGDYAAALTLGIGGGFGAEVLSYLVGNLRDEHAASEIYSDLCLAMVEKLPDFRWECSFRTWIFSMARYAKFGYFRGERRGIRKLPHAPLSRFPGLEQEAERVRTRTLAHLRTTNRNHLSDLRDELGELDQEVLILHVDRGMTFPKIARILWDGEGTPSADDIRKGANRLKQRFFQVKRRLKKLVTERGLLEGQ